MRLIFVDNADWRKKLLPLVFIRPVSALRIGILTIEEKWSKRLNCPYSHLTEDYLSLKYSLNLGEATEFLLIRGNLCPDERLVDEAVGLKMGEAGGGCNAG